MPKPSQFVIVRMHPHQCACLCIGVHMWERECLKVCPYVRVKVRMRLQRGVQVLMLTRPASPCCGSLIRTSPMQEGTMCTASIDLLDGLLDPVRVSLSPPYLCEASSHCL